MTGLFIAGTIGATALIPAGAPAANRLDGPSSPSGSGGAAAAQVVTPANDGATAAAPTEQQLADSRPRHQDEAAYARQKKAADAAAAAARASGATRPNAPSGATAGPEAPSAPQGTPSTVSRNFNGANNSACSCAPPDTHGAVGPSHYVEVVNARVVVYSKPVSASDPNPAALKSTALNTFFGTAEFVFDPRAYYDTSWNRFVVVATRRAASDTDTVRRWFIAASVTGDPTGAWFVYAPTFGGGPFTNGDWLDFPQVGMNQDAVIVDGNYFSRNANNSDSFVTTGVLSIAKARLYNGWGFSYAIRTGLAFTSQPALVAGLPIGQDTKTWLAASDAGADVIHLYRVVNADTPTSLSVTLQANIAVAAFNPPPNAPQPGTSQLLDTGDSRIQNTTTQVGSSLFLTFDTGDFGFATPRWYELNTSTNAVVQTGTFFRSGSSYDFNPSIGSNPSREVTVNWTSTDPPNNVNAEVRVSGRQSADPAGSIPSPGTTIFTSPVNYTGGHIFDANGNYTGVNRWGDYSAVSIDPSAYSTASGTCTSQRRAWVVNQKQDTTGSWSTRIAQVGFC